MKLAGSNFHRAIGRRLKAFREYLGKNTVQMAARFGIGRGAYLKKENGIQMLSFNALIMMSNEYRISMDWFLFNKAPMFLPDLEKEREKEKIRIEAALEKEKQRAGEMEKATQRIEELEKAARDNALTPEIKEMVDYMNARPSLQYELLSHFHRFKEEKGDLK